MTVQSICFTGSMEKHARTAENRQLNPHTKHIVSGGTETKAVAVASGLREKCISNKT